MGAGLQAAARLTLSESYAAGATVTGFRPPDCRGQWLWAHCTEERGRAGEAQAPAGCAAFSILTRSLVRDLNALPATPSRTQSRSPAVTGAGRCGAPESPGGRPGDRDS
jgi:hypothetical protein